MDVTKRSNPWDEYADAYAQWVNEREPVTLRDGDMLSRLLDLLGDLDGRDVLDAGCGQGFLSRILAQRGARVTGIDLAPRLIRIARQKDEASVHGPVGIRDRFRIVLRPGWCWMEGHALVAGTAAVPTGTGTRLAWVFGLRLPGGRLLRPLTRRGLERTLAALEQRARARTPLP